MKGTAMDAEQTAVAKNCMRGAHDGSLSFPEFVGKLIAAGFEGYAVDYRRDSQAFYLPDGDSVAFDMQRSAGSVSATFDAAEIERLVRWAQANPSDYSYVAFSKKVKAAGCAGYLVSFPGRRVVYFGPHRRNSRRTFSELTDRGAFRLPVRWVLRGGGVRKHHFMSSELQPAIAM